MNKEQLENLGLDENQIKEVFKLNGIAVEKAKGDLKAKETELENVKEQLDNANKEIEGFKDLNIDEIKDKAEKYKQDYEELEKKAKEELEKFKYEVAVKEYANNFNFANDRVKNSIIEDIKGKGFKLEEGKLLGADDYMKQLQENEPTSFKQETKEDDEKPKFIRPNLGGDTIKLNKDNILKVKDATERRRLIAENIELFK